jgi:arylsulfatase A-like enzyme/tetratricopeptide (TPR) repeat protein
MRRHDFRGSHDFCGCHNRREFFPFLGLLALLGLSLLSPACRSRPPASAPNILLITIDTLRADRVGRGLTPTLDRLTDEGLTFTNARANVPLTLPSHATIMTGALPPEHGVRENGLDRFDGSRQTMARVLRERGYRTGAFVGAFVLDRRFGLDDGFETYNDSIRRDPALPNRLEAERRAAEVVDAAIGWLETDSAPAPFFLWAHLYDPHAPYDPPPAALTLAKGDRYNGEVAYADAQAGRLIAAARARAGDTLVIAVVGDHGEGLGEHGESTHGMLAYDSTLRVPLVLAGAGVAHGRGEEPVTLRDVAPTLLGMAGVARPEGMTGANLLAAPDADAYAETVYPRSAGWSALRVLVDDQWKLIRSSEVELYDLRRDPGELTNVANARQSVAAAMVARAEATFARGRSTRAPVSGEAAERLRSLGYVAVAPGSTPAHDETAPNPRTAIAAWNRFEAALTRLNADLASDALPELRRLASGYPDARVFQSTLAQALLLSGRAREARDLIRRLVARFPDEASLYHDLASAAREAGDASEAIKAEQAAVALDPSNANAHNGLGLLHADAGRATQAAAAFSEATRLDPSVASFWANLGNARRGLGDLNGARKAYERALQLDAQSADAANGLGVLLVQQKRAPEAVGWFERAVAADPTLVEAQLNLGIAFQESGRPKEAAEQYRRVIARAPRGSPERQAATELLRGLP